MRYQLLATPGFSAEEVERLLQGDAGAPARTLVFSALRAESDDRFLEGLEAFFADLDWESVASASYGHHPAIACLGAARGESATDHLAATELVKLTALADRPDAAFALDVVRAIELGDASAAARVFERVESKLRAQPVAGMYSAPDNGVAALRLAALLRPTIAPTDEGQLRLLAERGMGHGAWPAWVAAAVAATRGLALDEDVVSLSDSRRECARMMLSVAHALDASLAEELLGVVVAQDWTQSDLEALALPWERSVESLKTGKLTTTRLIGQSVLKGVVAFDGYAGPAPKKRAPCKLSVKRHDTPAKALKDFEKAAKEPGEPIAVDQAALDARLHHHARIDDARERVVELLRRGARPGWVDSQHRETALHRAAASADCGEIVRLLLAAGADANAVDAYGNTPLDALDGATGEQSLAAERLVDAGGRSAKNALFKAAERGHHRTVPALLRAGADRAEVRSGKSPLEVALEKRHARTARALLGR